MVYPHRLLAVLSEDGEYLSPNLHDVTFLYIIYSRYYSFVLSEAHDKKKVFEKDHINNEKDILYFPSAFFQHHLSEQFHKVEGY